LEEKTRSADFWNNPKEAGMVSQNIAELKEEIETIESLKKEFDEIKTLESLLQGQSEAELQTKCIRLQQKVEREEFKIFLNGKYDKNNAIMEIFSGAGGQDSQDWATMLLRMYEKYFAKKGFKVTLMHQTFGEAGGPDGRIGTKNAVLEVKGKYAYGFLKHETGVHRLVRISPFNAQKLRHTSFALVDVLPEILEDNKEIEINPNDIRLETFKASGPGGQYVNKTESAVRIVHIPTGIAVTSQSERLQGKNRENAMKILYAKLSQLKTEERSQKLKEIKGDQVSASWGNQIRSYVLHPYQMVKDLRTQMETSDAQGVLDGDLESFIKEGIKIQE
jgi:peptide chain release factor 2